jgi:molybdate transport system substrate-binding protein
MRLFIRSALIRTVAVLLLAVTSAAAAFAAEGPAPLTVFAASSLTDVLQQIGTQYQAQSKTPVKYSFAASSALARQIESGARVDVFFSADEEWMDYLQARQLINRSTRRALLGNRLALIAPAGSSLTIELRPNAPLLAALGPNGRLATGDPDSVPVGKYAKAALTSLGLWAAIEPRLVRAENVRAALMYVARGEAPLGIVYETDAQAEPRVRLVDLFPQSSYPPITYPVAATMSASGAAASYLEFLRGKTATEIFVRAGFTVRDKHAPPPQAGMRHAAAQLVASESAGR